MRYLKQLTSIDILLILAIVLLCIFLANMINDDIERSNSQVKQEIPGYTEPIIITGGE